MFSKNELEALSRVNLSSVNKDELAELTDITIDTISPIEERFDKFLNDIKNPYCYKINGMPFKISFTNHEKSLDECLYNHFINKKEADENIL